MQQTGSETAERESVEQWRTESERQKDGEIESLCGQMLAVTFRSVLYQPDTVKR